MKYWKQGFYDEPVEGGVEITDERWLELIDGQAAGMLITEDEQGSPVLTEYVNSVPVPTYEQRVQQSIRERYSVDARNKSFHSYLLLLWTALII